LQEFPDIIQPVRTHRGIEILRQNGNWPRDRWHESTLIAFVYAQMDTHRRSFQFRLWVCIGVVIAASITAVIIGQTSVLVGLVLFAITVVTTFNYYQNNLAHYFNDPYEYMLEVVDNSLEDITQTEATAYAEIIMTRKEISQLSKRIRAISRNNFFFLGTREHNDKK